MIGSGKDERRSEEMLSDKRTETVNRINENCSKNWEEVEVSGSAQLRKKKERKWTLYCISLNLTMGPRL